MTKNTNPGFLCVLCVCVRGGGGAEQDGEEGGGGGTVQLWTLRD